MPFLRIHSEGVTISWLCVMHTLLLENQFPVTKDTQLPRFSAILMLLLRKHGIGADKAFSHDIFYAHCKACLFAGINISGINGEVMLGQWEFQVGPSVGISAGDEIWVARYTLEIIIEVADLVLIFDPKPVKGDWNGVGAHTNYSTKSMREEGGYEIIKKAIEKLRKRHAKHITACGEGKERRLTGKHETTDINTFSWLKIRIHWIVQ